MKKGVLAVAVASVLVGGCLAGCGGDDGGKVKIEFWGWGDKAEQDNYQTLVNQFMQEPGNEDIDVSYSGQDAKSYMLALEGRASSPPDLFMLPDEDFYGWVADDTLLTNIILIRRLCVWEKGTAQSSTGYPKIWDLSRSCTTRRYSTVRLPRKI